MDYIVAFGLYVLLAHSLGMGVLALLFREARELTFIERVSLAGCLGMGGVYLVGILCLAVQRPIGYLPIVGVTILLWGAALCLKRPLVGLRDAGTPKSPLSPIEWALLAMISLQFAYILFSTFWRPVAMHDDWAQWAGNAKYLFFHGAADQTYFHETNLSSYPLFIMINEVVLCKILGAWDDFLCKSFLVVLFIDFAGCLYTSIRRSTERIIALSGVFILASVPTYVRVGLDGTAEIPMSLFIALTAISTLRFIESKARGHAVLAAIFGGVVASVKLEGIYAMAVLMAVFTLAAWRESAVRIRELPIILGIPALFILPWSYLKGAGECVSTRMAGFSLAWAIDWQNYVEIIKVWGAMLLPSPFLLLVGPYFLVSVLFWILKNRYDRGTQYLLLMITGIAVTYAIGCYATGWAGQYSRLLIHSLGLVLIVVMRQLGSAKQALSWLLARGEHQRIIRPRKITFQGDGGFTDSAAGLDGRWLPKG